MLICLSFKFFIHCLKPRSKIFSRLSWMSWCILFLLFTKTLPFLNSYLDCTPQWSGTESKSESSVTCSGKYFTLLRHTRSTISWWEKNFATGAKPCRLGLLSCIFLNMQQNKQHTGLPKYLKSWKNLKFDKLKKKENIVILHFK